MRIAALIGLMIAAGAASADTVGVPAGCTVEATVVQQDCEVYQVLACEDGGPTRVDVYADGIFLRQEAYSAVSMTFWRYRTLVQELEVRSGRFEGLASMPADAVREVGVTLIRRQIGADGGPPPQDFEITITVDGPAIRDLPGGGDREVRRFRVVMNGASAEGSDLLVDYDPALGLPIWRSGTVRKADGTVVRLDVGAAHVLLPGNDGYMADRAPEGAACIAD